jgi:hypothetical protein
MPHTLDDPYGIALIAGSVDDHKQRYVSQNDDDRIHVARSPVMDSRWDVVAASSVASAI